MTDERDPKVSQRYRELGREEPPGELDAGILAASRRAAETRLAPLVPATGSAERSAPRGAGTAARAGRESAIPRSRAGAHRRAAQAGETRRGGQGARRVQASLSGLSDRGGDAEENRATLG